MPTEMDYFCCSEFCRGQFLLETVADKRAETEHMTWRFTGLLDVSLL